MYAADDVCSGDDCATEFVQLRSQINVTAEYVDECKWWGAHNCEWTLDYGCEKGAGSKGDAKPGNKGYKCCCESGLYKEVAATAYTGTHYDKCANDFKPQHCEWTLDYSCPGQSPGAKGVAWPGPGWGYKCCCEMEMWKLVTATSYAGGHVDNTCMDYTAKACEWTLDFNCPGQPAGALGAAESGNPGYKCCCESELWKEVDASAYTGTHDVESCKEWRSDRCSWTTFYSCPGQHLGEKGKATPGTMSYTCCCESGLWKEI